MFNKILIYLFFLVNLVVFEVQSINVVCVGLDWVGKSSCKYLLQAEGIVVTAAFSNVPEHYNVSLEQVLSPHAKTTTSEEKSTTESAGVSTSMMIAPFQQVERYLKEHETTVVIISLPRMRKERILKLLRKCIRRNASVLLLLHTYLWFDADSKQALEKLHRKAQQKHLWIDAIGIEDVLLPHMTPTSEKLEKTSKESSPINLYEVIHCHADIANHWWNDYLIGQKPLYHQQHIHSQWFTIMLNASIKKLLYAFWDRYIYNVVEHNTSSSLFPVLLSKDKHKLHYLFHTSVVGDNGENIFSYYLQRLIETG
ncbi:hypothetical protein RFI_08393, partial [Reticulomyxa filosa]